MVGSKFAKGSSIINSSGLCMMANTRPTRFFSPCIIGKTKNADFFVNAGKFFV